MSARRKAIIIILVLAILGAIGWGLWTSAQKGRAAANTNKNQAKASASPMPSESPSAGPVAGGSGASNENGAVLATTAPTSCEPPKCANAYGRVSLTPGSSLKSLPQQMRYEGNAWTATDSFTMHWKMSNSNTNTVWWDNNRKQDVAIEWYTAYLVSYKNEVTTVDLRGKPAEVIFKAGAARDIVIYGVYTTPPVDNSPAIDTDNPVLP